jgi:rhomboid protease GluP
VRASQGGELPLPYRWQWQLDRWKNSLHSVFGGESEPPRPRMCPACGTLVGIGATRCHECGTNLNFSLVAISKGLSEFFGGRAPVTMVILITNILLFAVSWLRTINNGGSFWGISNIELYRLGGLWTPAITHGEWFRLVLPIFLHGGLLHIGFNMMVLLDIGPVVEEVYGSARYLFLYLATGVVGFLVSAFTPFRSHPALGIGASGAIMGLIGLMIAITSKRGGASMQALRSRLVSWVVSIFVFGLLMPGIDNWGHFGGLIGGLLFGRIFADREPMNATERRQAYALGWTAGLVVLASFAMMALHFSDPIP